MFDVVITPAGVRDDLVACCEDAAEWRLHRAAELWQNRRDLAAVDALEAAAESIAELPDDDPQLGRPAWVHERLSDDQRVLAQGRCGCPRHDDAIGADRNEQGSPLNRSARAIPPDFEGCRRGA
jgi:hypothetical protein